MTDDPSIPGDVPLYRRIQPRYVQVGLARQPGDLGRRFPNQKIIVVSAPIV